MVGTGRETQSGDGEGASHGDGGGVCVCVCERIEGVLSFPYLGRLMLNNSKVLSRLPFFYQTF